jgi:TRAP-type C4-dicarboxylate transport system permease small subunit
MPANLLASVGTAWIFVIMCLVVADVIGRDFLDRPIAGVSEFSARSVASIVFLQLAAAICSGRMTRSDFLLNLIGKRSPLAVTILEVLSALVGVALFAAWPFRGLIVAGSIAGSICYLLTIPGILRRHGQSHLSDDPLGSSP